eukprot:TRINITY_DN18653_c0_g1_i1.p2 TRINITY_DN18653_c0_g1~~TRINITY_DN18653_c0_g1_i1.p2  ORF type:complete len:425 (+),score=133.87 TRINITY_DN18653_c0_g1_i1:87-1361(+)
MSAAGGTRRASDADEGRRRMCSMVLEEAKAEYEEGQPPPPPQDAWHRRAPSEACHYVDLRPSDGTADTEEITLGHGRTQAAAGHRVAGVDFTEAQGDGGGARARAEKRMGSLQDTNTALALELTRRDTEGAALREALDRARREVCALKGEVKIARTKAALKATEVVHLKGDYATLLARHQELVKECCEMQTTVAKQEKQLRVVEQKEVASLRSSVGEAVRRPLRDRHKPLPQRGRSHSASGQPRRVDKTGWERERTKLEVSLAKAEGRSVTLAAEAEATQKETAMLRQQHAALVADVQAARADREELLRILREDPSLGSHSVSYMGALAVLREVEAAAAPAAAADAPRDLADLAAGLRGMRDLWGPGGGDHVSPTSALTDGLPQLAYHITVEERRLHAVKKALDTYTRCSATAGRKEAAVTGAG